MECIKKSFIPIKNAIISMFENDPNRFNKCEEPFVIAEYGVATGFSSIDTLVTIIQTVR